MPNLFAYFMLAIWPLVVIIMFRRMPIERALIWSFIASFLVLPPVAAINLPMVPDLDKHAITALSVFACTLAIRGRSGFLPESKTAKLLLLIFILGPFATMLNNREPIMFAVGGLPGLRPYDALSACSYQAIAILPLLLGRRLLRTPAAQREFLFALATALAIYSIPMLYEARMSPQLNVMIYGFFQHMFDQSMRFGGFRPFVFTEHGLLLAFVVMLAVLAAATLARYAEPARRGRWLFATLYLCLMLLVCLSMGPVVYAIFLLPLILFASPRLQIRIAAVLAILVIAYPILRGTDLVPVNAMLAQAERIDSERAYSLRFRFDHEAMLLARAEEKPILGWGLWGRNMVYDYETGSSISVSDGRWIIVIGTAGWVGYIAEFGLLALPLFFLARRRLSPQAGMYAGSLALLLAINMVDLLPNASLMPITWLIAGMMFGYSESLRTPIADGDKPDSGSAKRGAGKKHATAPTKSNQMPARPEKESKAPRPVS